MYAGAPLTFGVFRSRLPEVPRPYRTPAGAVMAPLALLVANVIILWHPVFPLWWDMLVVAVLSLVIYYWAMAVALTREKIMEMINEVVVPEEEELGPQAGLATV
jgi:amino acid transporter